MRRGHIPAAVRFWLLLGGVVGSVAGCAVYTPYPGPYAAYPAPAPYYYAPPGPVVYGPPVVGSVDLQFGGRGYRHWR